MALPQLEADEAVEAWSDIPQVIDLAETIKRTLVKNGG
jgi:hypothetical protein